MAPKKDPVEAIRVARALELPIRLAGKPQNSTEKEYFEAIVRPLLEDQDVTYLGPVSQRDKVELLKGAMALLFPIDWEEHFGLVMIEAMACGTPVVARTRGSVPEVVDTGATGFHAPPGEPLEPLVERALLLDRTGVYERALERFSHRRMAKEYEALYRSLVGLGRHTVTAN
jgi:glycosyltransferase involved in cell wall biosynthesis